VSVPSAPSKVFAPTEPANRSAKGEPITFSEFSTVSVPAPPVFCAARLARLSVMPASAAE
jgi:hypothetical protein